MHIISSNASWCFDNLSFLFNSFSVNLLINFLIDEEKQFPGDPHQLEIFHVLVHSMFVCTKTSRIILHIAVMMKRSQSEQECTLLIVIHERDITRIQQRYLFHRQSIRYSHWIIPFVHVIVSTIVF